MHFHGISFMHPYKQFSRWQDMFEVWSMAGCAWYQVSISSTSCHRPDRLYGCMKEIP